MPVPRTGRPGPTQATELTLEDGQERPDLRPLAQTLPALVSLAAEREQTVVPGRAVRVVPGRALMVLLASGGEFRIRYWLASCPRSLAAFSLAAEWAAVAAEEMALFPEVAAALAAELSGSLP